MMRMNKRGQLASLDAILSLVLLMLALGYAFRVAEANFYALKQDELIYETKAVGSAAAELLVTSEETTCEVTTDTGNNFYITNCIDTSKLTNLNQKLLLNNIFGVRVKWAGGSAGDSLPSDDRTIYSEKRVVMLHGGSITKAELEQCFKGTGGCSRDTITIYVWRK
ncbi:MAG: hypothetical protein J7J87_02605 [Candidatus Diapherotrites archaeon]|nr:hypothetical protein [Candidatus Diapherotrites archaeon]